MSSSVESKFKSSEDRTFFEKIKKNFPKEIYIQHENHILKMLHTSSRPRPWDEETSLIRAGMRRSSNNTMRTQKGAINLLLNLITSLEFFMTLGTPDTMEEWFFIVLGGVIGSSQALDSFATLSHRTKSSHDTKEVILTPSQGKNPHQREDPAGSSEGLDDYNVPEERDPNLEIDHGSHLKEYGQARTFSSSISEGGSDDDDDDERESFEYHSTDELYPS